MEGIREQQGREPKELSDKGRWKVLEEIVFRYALQDVSSLYMAKGNLSTKKEVGFFSSPFPPVIRFILPISIWCQKI